MKSWIRILLFALSLGAGNARLQAGTVSVAAAANLVYALEALNAEFRRAEPGIELTATSGASGSLFAQIQNGAPIDVFLSADMDYPRKLADAGFAEKNSLVTYAAGRLVLWTMRNDVPVTSVEAVVHNTAVKKIAIAQTEQAPYGHAAKQALEKLGLWKDASPRLVTGENISQTAQFVETGNADAGFVALSYVLSPKLASKGHYLEVPRELYTPLEHGGVLTQRGAKNPAARRYLEFLRSEAAKKILQRFGYDTPKS